MDEIFEKATTEGGAKEIFAEEMPEKLSAKDLFAGDEDFTSMLDSTGRQRSPKGSTKVVDEVQKPEPKESSMLFRAAIIINIALLTAALGFVFGKPLVIKLLNADKDRPQQPVNTGSYPAQPTPAAKSQNQSAYQAQANAEQQFTEPQTIPAAKPEKMPRRPLPENDGIINGPVSWEMADSFFTKRQYEKAYYAYRKIYEGLTSHVPADEFLKDLLQVKMGSALYHHDKNIDTSAFFANALQSRSPVVRAMANYQLAFINMDYKQYLEARKNAYNVLALLKACEEYFNPNLEPDCYFIAAEAMTKQILATNGRPVKMPGKLWTDNMAQEIIPRMDQNQMRTFVQSGLYSMSVGQVTPRVARKEHPNAGLRISAVCIDAPADDLMAKIGAVENLEIAWQSSSEPGTDRPVSVYITDSPVQYVGEVAAGAAGLIARFDKNHIRIYNPEKYQSLKAHHQMLSGETISLWRRFLMKYRGDHRAANAHFGRALALECAGEPQAAIKQYQLIATRFTHNDLAQYALLNSSKIRTNLKDYAGARSDLTQLISLNQYHETGLANTAYLYLADASRAEQQYDQAIRVYKRLYHLDAVPAIKCQAALGIGLCYYNRKNYTEADKWLTIALGYKNKVDVDLRQGFFVMGKVKTKLGEYESAASALRVSLGKDMPTEEYVVSALELALAEANRGNFLEALKILDNVPVKHLSQQYITDYFITKSRVMRKLDLHENAASILRHRITFIADPQLRAKLSLELSMCYSQGQNYQAARDELLEAVTELGPSLIKRQIQTELAKSLLNTNEPKRAITVCKQLLQSSPPPELRKQALYTLGRAYSRQEKHEMAALAFAGKI